MKKNIIIYSLLLLIFSCAPVRRTILYVAPQKINCTGMVPQKCYQIKIDNAQEWTYFYDEIEGFKYQEGFEYALEVVVEKTENPPADASSIRYKLIKIVSKKVSNLEINNLK